jgi:hypothetical protein
MLGGCPVGKGCLNFPPPPFQVWLFATSSGFLALAVSIYLSSSSTLVYFDF